MKRLKRKKELEKSLDELKDDLENYKYLDRINIEKKKVNDNNNDDFNDKLSKALDMVKDAFSSAKLNKEEFINNKEIEIEKEKNILNEINKKDNNKIESNINNINDKSNNLINNINEYNNKEDNKEMINDLNNEEENDDIKDNIILDDDEINYINVKKPQKLIYHPNKNNDDDNSSEKDSFYKNVNCDSDDDIEISNNPKTEIQEEKIINIIKL